MDIMQIVAEVAKFMIPFLFAISFHEYAHGWVANKLGDPTARLMGRLSLNPTAHADPIGTYLLPILAVVTKAPFFGWARPVPVNENNLKNPKVGMFWVASAGPASNVLLAFFGALGFGLAQGPLAGQGFSKGLSEFSQAFVMINMSLAVFNLIPVHPLDGGKIIAIFLPNSLNQWLEDNQVMISFALLFLFLSGVVGKFIYGPVIYSSAYLLALGQALVGG
ncbi:MAG: site-2 protease family protein [Oligoflexia bacterium]|nr:site-2 protease family protein [Oligoflexia bacterium]